METFGSRLQSLRKKKKLSQDELAELLNKSKKQVISTWENGKAKPSADDLVLLVEVLETSLDYLMRGIESGVSREKYDELQNKYIALLEGKQAGNTNAQIGNNSFNAQNISK